MWNIFFFIFFGSTEQLHLNVAEAKKATKNTLRFICLIEVTQSVIFLIAAAYIRTYGYALKSDLKKLFTIHTYLQTKNSKNCHSIKLVR